VLRIPKLINKILSPTLVITSKLNLNLTIHFACLLVLLKSFEFNICCTKEWVFQIFVSLITSKQIRIFITPLTKFFKQVPANNNLWLLSHNQQCNNNTVTTITINSIGMNPYRKLIKHRDWLCFQGVFYNSLASFPSIWTIMLWM